MIFLSLNLKLKMKSKLALTLITSAVVASAVVAQPPPSPPAPPAPPSPAALGIPPNPPDRHDKLPKVPVTFLGVETSDVPRVVSEQLGLAKGFGLVVDYVVPDGPAAAAGVQPNDILKLLNDQILTEPDQLSKLIRSFSENTTVTLTVLRKGQEQKIPVKLGKKEVPQRRAGGPGSHGPGDFKMDGMDFGDLRDRMKDMKEQMTEEKQDMIQDAVMKAHEEVARAREEAQRANEQAREQAQQVREQAQRVREQVQRAKEQAQRVNDQWHGGHGEIKITRSDDNGLRTTRLDVAKAQIVFSDDKGELRLDNNDGKRILTAKDAQGRLLFSGPVETKEDLDKVPAEVRDRYNSLQQKDLPSVISPEDKENDGDDEMDDEDDQPSVEQVSIHARPRLILTNQNFRL
jgi:serine protease Do